MGDVAPAAVPGLMRPGGSAAGKVVTVGSEVLVAFLMLETQADGQLFTSRRR